jgi:hypothetical protein
MIISTRRPKSSRLFDALLRADLTYSRIATMIDARLQIVGIYPNIWQACPHKYALGRAKSAKY